MLKNGRPLDFTPPWNVETPLGKSSPALARLQQEIDKMPCSIGAWLFCLGPEGIESTLISEIDEIIHGVP